MTVLPEHALSPMQLIVQESPGRHVSIPSLQLSLPEQLRVHVCPENELSSGQEHDPLQDIDCE